MNQNSGPTMFWGLVRRVHSEICIILAKTEGGVLFSNFGQFWGFRGIFLKRGPKSKFRSNNVLGHDLVITF